MIPTCDVGGNVSCHESTKCYNAKGERGTVYDVYDKDGNLVGKTCLTPSENLGKVTPEMVMREAEKYSWPKSELIVQPPHGKTLINFDTNFYTENTGTTQQPPFTLLGRFRINVEAWPVEYHFNFDHGDPLVTSNAGAAYPDLQVTHDYTEKGVYHPSVDTVYAGRYRINGGRWQDLPGTLTVVGDAVELRAVEARPVLTG